MRKDPLRVEVASGGEVIGYLTTDEFMKWARDNGCGQNASSLIWSTRSTPGRGASMSLNGCALFSTSKGERKMADFWYMSACGKNGTAKDCYNGTYWAE